MGYINGMCVICVIVVAVANLVLLIITTTEQNRTECL